MHSRDFCFWLQGYFEVGHEPGDWQRNRGKLKRV